MAPPSASPKKRKHATFKSTATPLKVSVTPNNPSHDPIVVSFPRGVPTSVLSHDKNADISTKTPNLPHFTWSKLKPNSDRGRRITGSDNTCTYTATSGGRGHDGRLTKLYVAVVNKKTNTMKLIPAAEKGTTFALEQTVNAYKPNVSDDSMMVGGFNDGSKTTARDRINMLVESFGSKKKQKVMASKAANVVNINKVVGAGDVMMDSVVKQGGVISEGNREMLTDKSKAINENDASLLQSRKQTLPPFDPNAPTPSKIFNPQTMADTTAWSQISRIVDKVIKRAEEQDSTSSTDWINNLLGKGKPHAYVPESVMELLQPLDPFTKKHHMGRIKSTFFLFLLMRFHNKVSRMNRIIGDYNECIRQTRIPAEVASRFLELFMMPIETGQSGFVCTSRYMDKLHFYILITYVIANGNDMKATVNQLCKDLKLEENRFMMLYREAGFAVKKSGKGEIGVSLSVPLVFPPPRKGKRKD